MARCIASLFASSKSKFNRLSCAKVWLNNVASPQKVKQNARCVPMTQKRVYGNVNA